MQKKKTYTCSYLMEPVSVYVYIMYISPALHGVAIKVFPPTSQFHRSWGSDAKQLPLKHTHKKTVQWRKECSETAS